MGKTSGLSSKDAIKTITINVSSGGCFIFAAQNWEVRDKVILLFKELTDQTPVIGDIRWTQVWGDAMQIPGIGVRFEKIKENQLSEICRIGKVKS